MNRIFKRSKIMYVLAIIFAVALVALFIVYCVNAKTWVSKEYNKHITLGSGAILDRNGEVLSETVDGKRVYNEDAAIRTATLLTVGDAQGYISTGAQTAFKSQLIGYDIVNGLYSTDKDGKKKDLTLTIDAQLSVTAYEAMGDYQGCIGVYNYKTGEILCAVSTPTYDPNNKPADIDSGSEKYDAIYMNRFFSGTYTPGSTFKVITAASALENISGIEGDYFRCPGYYAIDSGNRVKCSGTHGTLSFRSALNHSCNSAFAKIASQLTNEQLTATAEEFGFNQSISVNGMKCATSTFTLEGAYMIDRAWAGIGQYETKLNPLHECLIMGSIANKTGTTPEPILIKGSVAGQISYCDSEIATKLDDLLRSNVTNYYGNSKFPNLSMCGKTGTAQVSNDEPHTLFAGYSQRDDLPLCIIVILENSGGYGVTNCIPIANTVMQKALDLYT